MTTRQQARAGAVSSKREPASLPTPQTNARVATARTLAAAITPPFLVDELPPAKAPGYPKSAWRLMAEANPGRWVCVKVAPGTCADRATKSMTAKGFRSCYRKLDDASEFGVNGPAVVTFAMFGGAA